MLKKTFLGLGLAMMIVGGGPAHAITVEGITVDCAGFVRNPDGSWSTIGDVEIKGPQSSFTVGPRTELKVGHKYQGLDIARILNASCP